MWENRKLARAITTRIVLKIVIKMNALPRCLPDRPLFLLSPSFLWYLFSLLMPSRDEFLAQAEQLERSAVFERRGHTWQRRLFFWGLGFTRRYFSFLFFVVEFRIKTRILGFFQVKKSISLSLPSRSPPGAAQHSLVLSHVHYITYQ